MGAVSFSLDERLVVALQAGLPLRTFIETGTYQGDTLARMLPHFDVLQSVELSTPLWRDAAERFAGESRVTIVNADSSVFLTGLQPALAGGSTLYWLDAHWCAVDNVAGETSQCPLLAELRAIGPLQSSSVILIDDARLFLAPPALPHEISQWPRFHDIVVALLAMSADHEIMVVNDVIAFYPRRVRSHMEAYAQNAGVDWIAAADRVHDLLGNEAALREKEAVLQQMGRSLTEKEAELQVMARSLLEKEHVIQQFASNRDAALQAGRSSEHEANFQALERSLEDKEHKIRDLASRHETARRETEAMVQEMARSLTEKEVELQAMARSLVEKEHVIDELASERRTRSAFGR